VIRIDMDSRGRLAVQIAKHLGAVKMIATGRKEEELEELRAIGAHIVVPFSLELLPPTGERHHEAAIKDAIAVGVNVVLDYLWGKTRPIHYLI
jgi:NADPH:quinone reductase-like Zn-dependent oxidoreductase